MTEDSWRKEVRERLMDLPDAPSMEDFSEPTVSLLADHCTPEAAVQKMMRSKEALEELRTLERVSNPEILRQMFFSGQYQVLGRDRDGRPVVWHRGYANQARWTKPFAEAIVVFTWITMWGKRSSWSPSQSFLMIYDETALELPDFCVGYVRSLGRILGSLVVTPHPDLRSVYFLRNNLFTFFATLPGKIMGVSGPTVPQFKTDKREVLSMLRDPTNYPDWFLPGGKPFIPSHQTMGNFADVLERKGFLKLTLRDIHVCKVVDAARGDYPEETGRDPLIEKFPLCSVPERNSGSISTEDPLVSPKYPAKSMISSEGSRYIRSPGRMHHHGNPHLDPLPECKETGPTDSETCQPF